jgi:hypothetical protein
MQDYYLNPSRLCTNQVDLYKLTLYWKMAPVHHKSGNTVIRMLTKLAAEHAQQYEWHPKHNNLIYETQEKYS